MQLEFSLMNWQASGSDAVRNILPIRFQSCYDKQYQMAQSGNGTSANRSPKVASIGKLADLSKQARWD